VLGYRTSPGVTRENRGVAFGARGC
jgi:hypothetical protein